MSYSERFPRFRCTVAKLLIRKGILPSVSNTIIYCSRDKFGTVYLVQYIFENSTVNINVPCNSYEDVMCCSPECILTFPYASDNIPLRDQAVRLLYPLFFCTLHASPKSITKHLAGLRLEISVAKSDPPIRECQ